MAVEGPSKTDIQLVFKRLRAIPTNKTCFDCNAKNPTWASVTYGVFICLDCSAVHRSLGVHLSFVRSTQLDTNWTWLQLRQMQLGGNASANIFFRQHNCNSTDAQQKYNSRAAQLYKEKVSQSATQALKTYGTQLLIDNVNQENTEEASEKEEPDFFEEHSSTDNVNNKIDQNSVLAAKKITPKESAAATPTTAPNVDNAFCSNNTNAEKSHIIGVRNTTAKRSTLGGKKGGLGAQKVKANFADIERDAALADQIKFSEKQESVKIEDTDDQVQSVRLAYHDLSLQQKREEDKLKQTDPKKAEQVERLGMGFNTNSGVSHSAFNDMKTLDADVAVKKDTFVLDRTDEDDFFDCFTNIPSFRMEFKDLGSLLAEAAKNKKKGNWKDDVCDVEPLNTDKSKDYGSKVVWEEPKSYSSPKPQHTAQRSVKPSTSSNDSSGDAQKKFGAAKSISSAQYFGDNNAGDERMNLCQFEGSTSISSADLFGRPNIESSGLQTPDFDDVKESVRQGVTKVAGKLSSLANGVMSSIQERYGSY